MLWQSCLDSISQELQFNAVSSAEDKIIFLLYLELTYRSKDATILNKGRYNFE